jgi:O-antigen/teichoic acid export membrane protein
VLFAGRNAAWLLGCRVAADLLNFVLFLIVSRAFGPEGMGVYAYGFAIAGFAYAATTLGIDDYGMREYIRRPPADRPRLMADLLGAQSCIVVVVVVALAVYLLLTRPTSSTLEIILSLTLYQLCAALAMTLFVPAMAEQQMMRPAVVTLVCRALAMLVAMVLIWGEHASLQTALLPFALAGVMMTISALHSARSFGVGPRLHWSPAVLKEGARALWTFAAADVMGMAMTRIGVIVLSLRVGEAAAGIYAAGLKFAEAACLPLLFAGIAAYPRLCRAYHDPPEFRRLTQQSIAWGFVLALACALGVYFLVPRFIVPLLGTRYADAGPIIGTMGVLILVQGMEIVLARLLLAANLNAARAAWMSVGAMCCAAATIAVAPVYGVGGVVAVVVANYVLIILLYASSLYGILRRGGYAQAAVRGGYRT